MASSQIPVVSRMRELAAEPIDWVWPQRLAAGKLCLLDGDPSQGKSLVTLDLAARFTTASELPDGYRPNAPTSILLIGAEDDVRDTVVPRLVSAGADPDYVHIFHGRRDAGNCLHIPSFPEDCDLLQQVIATTGARLVIADPLMSFLSNHLCAVNDQMVRQALGPLARVALATHAAIILVRHLNKGGCGQRAIYRGSGSIAIIASARTAFVIGRDPEDPELRLLACTKNNLTALPPALGFRIVSEKGVCEKGSGSFSGTPEKVPDPFSEPGTHPEKVPDPFSERQPVIAWTGVVDVSADEVVLRSKRRPGEALAEAVNFLQAFLERGPAGRDEIFRKARGAGIADRTLIRAKAEVHILSEQCYRNGQNLWY